MAHHFKCLHNHFTMNWNIKVFIEKKGRMPKTFAFIQRLKVHNTCKLRSLSKKRREREREKDIPFNCKNILGLIVLMNICRENILGINIWMEICKMTVVRW